MATRPRIRTVLFTSWALLGVAGCSSSGDAAPTIETAAVAQQIGIFDPDQLPDPCTLVGTESIGTLIAAPVSPVANEPAIVDGEPLLFRTCMWGDTESGFGAIGIQIGVPDLGGRDVVANRSSAMDPALSTSIGQDGKETMNLGELPTGGGRGATIFFRHNGYSVLIGHVGPGSSLETVENLALEAITALDA
jgi:hypothetical protein